MCLFDLEVIISYLCAKKLNDRNKAFRALFFFEKIGII
jgi:hypothetical protein